MSEKPSPTFRPRARLMLLLGDELIRDAGIAVFELVKNAYDADATRCDVTLEEVHRHVSSTLGSEPRQAAAALHRLLVEIEDGTFRRPSEAVSRPLKTGPAPRNTVRELCDAFLAEKRRLRGKKTARDYRNRLVPLIEFAEQPLTIFP